jgi:hypothetical protein
MFSWAKIYLFNFLLHCSIRTKKLLDTKVKKGQKKVFLGSFDELA